MRIHNWKMKTDSLFHYSCTNEKNCFFHSFHCRTVAERRTGGACAASVRVVMPCVHPINLMTPKKSNSNQNLQLLMQQSHKWNNFPTNVIAVIVVIFVGRQIYYICRMAKIVRYQNWSNSPINVIKLCNF